MIRAATTPTTSSNQNLKKNCRDIDYQPLLVEENENKSGSASSFLTNHLQPEAINNRKRRYESFINEIQQQNAVKSVDSFLITPLQVNEKENHENNKNNDASIENRNFFELWRNQGLKKKRSSVENEDLVETEERKVVDVSISSNTAR
jgi:hypothetical protein